jgi:DNA-binding transcriptional LysR family regulator
MSDWKSLREMIGDVIPFVMAAEAGSFRRAASQLGLTPAAMSKAIQRLEDELGMALFHRTTRHLSLTEAGAALLEHSREALHSLREGKQHLERKRQAIEGDLWISLPHILGRPLARALPRWLEAYPETTIRLQLSDHYSDLIGEGIDIALRMGSLADSSLVVRRLLETRWVLVASPSYLARRGLPVTLEDLSQHEVLFFRSKEGHRVKWRFPDAAPSGWLEEKAIRVDVDQGDLLREMALAGCGIAQVLSFMVCDALKSGALVELLPQSSRVGLTIHALCLPQTAKSPKIRAALEFLQSAFSAFASSP